MAGRQSYIIANPDNESTETALKTGKVPTFATWAFYTEEAPHYSQGAGWVRMGYSYQATREDALKKALPDFRKNGHRVTVTRVLPAA